jgi:hypothetical protein
MTTSKTVITLRTKHLDNILRSDDGVFSPVSQSELRILRRLAINPSINQAGIAKQLGVTRSAVNQIWKRMQSERNLQVRSSLDYGGMGLKLLFGWARTSESLDSLSKFIGWLTTQPYVTQLTKADLSSTVESVVYFEAVLKRSLEPSRFEEQLVRFQKRPYDLTIEIDEATHLGNHLNLGLYDGSSWAFRSDFQLAASMEMARSYVDVLPETGMISQSSYAVYDHETATIAALLEDDYHLSSHNLSQKMADFGEEPPSDRTLRRRMKQIKKRYMRPFLDVRRIGLTQHVFVCLVEEEQSTPISHMLRAYANVIPKVRTVSGLHQAVLEIQLPETMDWFALTNTLSGVIQDSADFFAFLTKKSVLRKGLEAVIPSLK